MGAPLRIAAHNGARSFGGGEKWLFLLLAGLQRRGHEVHVFCRDEAMCEKAREYEVSASVGRLGGHFLVTDALTVGLKLRRFQPDVLLVSTFKKLWLAGLASRIGKVRRVVARIGLSTDLPRRHWTYRLAIRRWTDAVLINADGVRERFVADLPGYDPRRVATVYDGIELEECLLTAPEARAALGIPRDVALVGMVARLSRQKRIDRMLEALVHLPTVHLALAGEGELREELLSRAEELGVRSRVHFLGFQTDVTRVLCALDVFALTSDTEGMANAMLEAMTMGVPVVTTPVSGASEALAPDHGGAAPGRIVPVDPPGIARAVREILDDPALASAMGRAGKERARSTFSFEAMLDAWELVLAGGDPAEVHQGVVGRSAAPALEGE